MKQMWQIKRYALDLSKRSRGLAGEDYDLWHSLKRSAVSIGMSCDELAEPACTAASIYDAVGNAREMRFLTRMQGSEKEQVMSRRILLHFMMYEYDAKKKRKFDAQKRRSKD